MAPDPTTTPLHMDLEHFRRHGHEVIDWIADYLEQVESFPVSSPAEPGTIAAGIPETVPERGEDFAHILADVERVIMPGITHWQSPNWFAYFPANSSPPSMLADMISSGLGVQGMLWATSPACTELETRMLDWMAGLLGLGSRFLSSGPGGGVIQDTASSATVCAMLAARDRIVPATDQGMASAGQHLCAYTSTQAHSSIAKAAGIVGIGRDQLRLIDVDDRFAIRPEALRAAIERDLESGHRPFFVSATIGTTASGALDPLPALREICREFDLWLHVDGAMFGTAACCDELRWIQKGCEDADSYTMNPHKWMLVNFDCNCLWVADRRALIASLSILPEYLRNAASSSGEVIDYRDWQIPLGRRFRSLKLWFVLRSYGAEGIRRMVREHLAMTRDLVDLIRQDERFEIVAPCPLTLVCIAHVDGDDVTQSILDRANASGRIALSHARLDGRLVIRISIGQYRTTLDHVREAWSLIQSLSPS